MDNSTRRCVSTCPSLPQTFGDPNSGYCEYNCTNNWYGYASSSKRICLAVCPSTPKYYADMQSKVCVLKCANLTYQFVNNTFRGCLYECPSLIYNGSTTVDLY
jgi:hypothetical protein